MKHHRRKIRFSILKITRVVRSSSIPASKMTMVSNLNILIKFSTAHPTFSFLAKLFFFFFSEYHLLLWNVSNYLNILFLHFHKFLRCILSRITYLFWLIHFIIEAFDIITKARWFVFLVLFGITTFRVWFT